MMTTKFHSKMFHAKRTIIPEILTRVEIHKMNSIVYISPLTFKILLFKRCSITKTLRRIDKAWDFCTLIIVKERQIVEIF